VPKGHYDLDASLEGFEGAARRNLDVEGDTVDVELKLALAELHTRQRATTSSGVRSVSNWSARRNIDCVILRKRNRCAGASAYQ